MPKSIFTPEELEQLAMYDIELDGEEYTLQDYRDAILEEKQIQWLEKSYEERKRAMYLKQYAEDHKTEIVASQAAYYQNHREELLQKQKERYRKRRESVLEYQRLYSAAYPDAVKERKKRHWEKTKDAYNAKRRQQYAERKAQKNAATKDI